jgi:hypothetical protein
MDHFKRIVEARKEAGLEVVRCYEEERAPFILYLHTFGLRVVHQDIDWVNVDLRAHEALARAGFDPSNTGDGSDVSPEALGMSQGCVEAMLFDALPAGANMLMVGGNESLQLLGSLRSSRVPTLVISDEEWQETVRALIQKAELIVAECPMLGDSLRWELETCIASGKRHQTIVIVPSPGGPTGVLDHLRPLEQFHRVIWTTEIQQHPITQHFLLGDLLGRVAKIASTPVADRMRGVTQPVTYAGVLHGFAVRRRQHEWDCIFSQHGPGTHYYLFWEAFRSACLIVTEVNELRTINAKDMQQELVYLCLLVLRGIAAGLVDSDDPNCFINGPLVIELASSICTMLDEIEDDSMLSGYAERVFNQLGLPTCSEVRRASHPT